MRLTKKQIARIKELRKTMMVKDLAIKFGVSRHTIKYHTNKTTRDYAKEYLKSDKAKEYFKNWFQDKYHNDPEFRKNWLKTCNDNYHKNKVLKRKV